MTENELIGKVRKLRQIKPRKDWVILTKRRILGQPPTLQGLFRDSLRIFPRLVFQYKLAFASLVIILILGGSFGFAQDSLPGDFLFPIKKITEKTRAVFISETDKPKVQLELANKRLEELTKIAETHQIKKLAPAISEFQASVSEAARKLVKIKEPQNSLETGKAVVAEIKKLEKNKEKIESLGVVVGDAKEIENVMCQLVERETKDLGTLTEKQEELLSEAENYLEEGECTLAFEKIWLLSNLSVK